MVFKNLTIGIHKIVDENCFFRHEADIRTIAHCVRNLCKSFVISINYNDDLGVEKEVGKLKKSFM